MSNRILILFLPFLLCNCTTESDLFSQAKRRYPELSSCKPSGINETILCGTFTVYENRSAKGKTLPINVYLFPATQPNTDRRTFLEYNGGPASPNENLRWLYEKGGPSHYLRQHADILIMDQRGTGASLIPCEAFSGLQLGSQLFHLKAIKACLAESREQVDLSQYNTDQSVEDLEEVRQWLGIPQIDFSGLSYGTRVVLEYMRRYPKRVRSMILSGTVSPTFGYAKHLDLEIEQQLQALINRCEADSACAQHFPNFRTNLYELKDQLKEKPLSLTLGIESQDSLQLSISDTLFVRMVGGLFLSGTNIETLPLLIKAFREGDPAPLVRSDVRRSNRVTSVYMSQFCPEDILNNPVDPEALSQLFTMGELGLMEVRACEEWQQFSTPTWLDQPLQGDAPVLLITGANDTQTPPRMGDNVQKALPNARHIVLPNEGHGLINYACWDTLVSQFLARENLWELETSCAQLGKRPAFELPEDEKK